MKRTYIITLLLLLCSLLVQAQDSRFEKLADMDGVTSVYISKAMLALMPDIKTSGVNVGQIAAKLDNIWILSCDKSAVVAQLRKGLSFLHPQNGYEELMRVNDEGEKTTIYMKEEKKKNKEFVLTTGDKNALTVIVVTGDLTLKEVQEILNKG